MKNQKFINIRNIFSIQLLLALLIFSGTELMAQVEVVKSTNTEIINGKEYYIHQVEAGQTLYSISKAYGVSIEDIIFDNPSARDGIQVDQQLKIPLISRGQMINEKLKEGKLDYIFHVVKAGQTLTSIAAIYSVPVGDLIRLNPELTGILKVGQYVKIPIKTIETTAEKDTVNNVMVRHKVAPLETWYSLSKEYNTSISDLKEANPGIAYPKVGEFVNVPGKEGKEEEMAARKPDTLIHIVSPGETLYSIARTSGVSLDQIRKMNPGLGTVIHPGYKIKLPPRTDEQKYILHQVKERRSTLKKIADLYQAPIEEVERLNPQISRRVVRGQSIRIPVDIKKAARKEEIVVMPEIEKEKLYQGEEIESEVTFENLQQTYRVALMLPFSLEEVPAIDTLADLSASQLLQSSPFRFIQFYQGFLMAADSLEKLGLKLDLHVYDIDQDISKTIKTLQLAEMNRMDLIIGPLYRNSFTYVANYARMLGIPVVNPLSQKEEILDGNPYVFKVMPARSAQADELTKLVNKDFRYDNIIIVHPNQYQDQEVIGNIRTKLMDVPAGTREVYTVPYATDSLAGIMAHMTDLKNNLIIVYSETEALPVDLMARLNDLRDTLPMTMIGMPDWDKFEHLENDYLMNLNTILFSSSLINYQDTLVKRFILDYRAKYLAEPLEYAYGGYDIGMYFLRALMHYGRDFGHYTDRMDMPQLHTRFIFRKIPNGGYVNTYWDIYRIENYHLIPVNIE